MSAEEREAALKAQKDLEAQQEQIQRDEQLSRELARKDQLDRSTAEAKSQKLAKGLAEREVRREGLRVNPIRAQERVLETVTAEKVKELERNQRRLEYRRNETPITGLYIRGNVDKHNTTTVKFCVVRIFAEKFQVLHYLSYYGYTELLEIRAAALKSKSTYKQIFLDEVNRLLQRMANIVVIPPIAESSQRPRRRLFEDPNSQQFPIPNLDLNILAQLKFDDDISMLNIVKPEGVIIDEGITLEEPEPGMGFMDSKGFIKFFRDSEIPIAPTGFLKALICRCKTYRLPAEDKVRLYQAEINRRPLDV